MKTFNPSEYVRKKYRQIVLKLDREKDADIIQKLESVSNITAYARDLIVEDLKHGKETEQV